MEELIGLNTLAKMIDHSLLHPAMTDDAIRAGCFVKTSTGYGFVKQADGKFAYRGATDEHLRLMRAHSPPWVAIKAAGGIRSLDDVLRVRRLGVTRIGATATEEIMEEAKRRGIA